MGAAETTNLNFFYAEAIRNEFVTGLGLCLPVVGARRLSLPKTQL